MRAAIECASLAATPIGCAPERIVPTDRPTPMLATVSQAEQWIGWAAVTALFLTMSGQAWKQWRDRVRHGIGKFFFWGQVLSSTLFLAYSVLKHDLVFVVGNSLVLLASIVGGLTFWWNRTRRASERAP
jgi:uncharacterized protein with PQ loop repeat